jgi:23S rRNA (adenine2503-C2)-methyltransferase
MEGLVRNLSAAEILEQIIQLRNLLPADEQLTSVVVMGMGEPLANLDHLLEALKLATSREGLGIGARHITVSTVGLPAKIRRLADLGKPYHLAVSLHASNDELRTRLVPSNDRIGIAAILDAADYYFEKNGRRVTFEYVLLGGLNDLPEQALELARLLRNRCAHINLIPFNGVPGLPYRQPTPESMKKFVQRLRQENLSVKVRKRKGFKIEAACGQLRRAAMLATQSQNPAQEVLSRIFK